MDATVGFSLARYDWVHVHVGESISPMRPEVHDARTLHTWLEFVGSLLCTLGRQVYPCYQKATFYLSAPRFGERS